MGALWHAFENISFGYDKLNLSLSFRKIIGLLPLWCRYKVLQVRFNLRVLNTKLTTIITTILRFKNLWF